MKEGSLVVGGTPEMELAWSGVCFLSVVEVPSPVVVVGGHQKESVVALLFPLALELGLLGG